MIRPWCVWLFAESTAASFLTGRDGSKNEQAYTSCRDPAMWSTQLYWSSTWQYLTGGYSASLIRSFGHFQAICTKKESLTAEMVTDRRAIR